MRKAHLMAAVGLLLMAGVAQAMPMSWQYSGLCTIGDCAIVPSISGTLNADPELLGPANQINQVLLVGDIIDYSFMVGAYSFSGSGGLGSYDLDASGNITGGVMTFGNILQLEFLQVGSAVWSFQDVNLFKTSVAAAGPGGYARVSEPGALLLLGAGLIVLGLFRRFAASR